MGRSRKQRPGGVSCRAQKWEFLGRSRKNTCWQSWEEEMMLVELITRYVLHCLPLTQIRTTTWAWHMFSYFPLSIWQTLTGIIPISRPHRQPMHLEPRIEILNTSSYSLPTTPSHCTKLHILTQSIEVAKCDLSGQKLPGGISTDHLYTAQEGMFNISSGLLYCHLNNSRALQQCM